MDYSFRNGMECMGNIFRRGDLAGRTFRRAMIAETGIVVVAVQALHRLPFQTKVQVVVGGCAFISRTWYSISSKYTENHHYQSDKTLI